MKLEFRLKALQQLHQLANQGPAAVGMDSLPGRLNSPPWIVGESLVVDCGVAFLPRPSPSIHEVLRLWRAGLPVEELEEAKSRGYTPQGFFT